MPALPSGTPAGIHQPKLLRHRDAVDDLPVSSDATVAKVVDGHPRHIDAATRGRVGPHRAGLRPEHSPRDRYTISVGDGVRDLESNIRERRARDGESCLELLTSQRRTVPRVAGVAVNRVRSGNKPVDSFRVTAIPHGLHEVRKRA